MRFCCILFGIVWKISVSVFDLMSFGGFTSSILFSWAGSMALSNIYNSDKIFMLSHLHIGGLNCVGHFYKLLSSFCRYFSV